MSKQKIVDTDERKREYAAATADPTTNEEVNPATNGGDAAANPATNNGGGTGAVPTLAAISVSSSVIGQKLASRHVPIRKPGKLEFIRTNPEQAFDTVVIEDKVNREVYFAHPRVVAGLATQGIVTDKRLVRVITRQGVNMIWPIGIENDGRINPWHESAREAERLAHDQWVRLVSNMSVGAYDIYIGEETTDEPDWTSQSFQEILEIAFKGRIIDDPDHRLLRGWMGRQI
jgi:hypothetical protein